MSLILSIVVMSLSYLVLVSPWGEGSPCSSYCSAHLVSPQSFTSSLLHLALVLIPMIMSGALLNTLTSSTITKVVPQSSTGTSLGLNMATHSLIRSVAPTLGGYMYQWLGYPSFGLLGFVLNGAMAVVVLLKGGIPGLQN